MYFNKKSQQFTYTALVLHRGCNHLRMDAYVRWFDLRIDTCVRSFSAFMLLTKTRKHLHTLIGMQIIQFLNILWNFQAFRVKTLGKFQMTVLSELFEQWDCSTNECFV